MPSSITFILPQLFNNADDFIDDSHQTSFDKLCQLLSKAKQRSPFNLNQWLSKKFHLQDNFQNSAHLMALAEGLANINDDTQYHWLRADPVMLSVTHNGIYCTGNRALKLTDEEHRSIEVIINRYLNNHYADESIVFMFSDSGRGYLKYTHHDGCEFTDLSTVMGQDISHLLPSGKNASFWHVLLTDIQMLLHSCDVNQKRTEKGLPTISGLWLWGETGIIQKEARRDEVTESFYSDNPGILGALDKPINILQLDKSFDSTKLNTNEMILFVSDFSDISLQNDKESYAVFFNQWVVHWLIPALEAVDKNLLQQVNFMADDGHCYQYTQYSKFCFWRKNTLIDKSSKSTDKF